MSRPMPCLYYDDGTLLPPRLLRFCRVEELRAAAIDHNNSNAHANHVDLCAAVAKTIVH